MSELGTAYASLMVSTRDMKSSVKAAMRELGQEVDKGTTKQSGKLMAGVGGAIKGAAKAGAVGIGLLGGAVAGLALKGGISRALAIEDSRAKLDGLGHSAADVDGIMADALASVKGTSFGLGEAASAAASAVASGIKPGKDLQRTLKLTGDAATIAGVPFSEMSAIMGKAAASNKVQGDILAQLGDQGIPIVQLLGETMNMSADEIYDASKKGTISFANLQDAIESGMGGAALKSGKTFRGAWANVMAALGRGGETVIKPVLDMLRDGFNKAIPIIDNVTNALKPFMERFTSKAPEVIAAIADGFKSFADGFKGVNSEIEKEGFSKFMEVLGTALATSWDILRNQIIPALQDFGEWVQKNRAWLEPFTVAVAAGAVAWKLYMLAMGGYKSIVGNFIPVMGKMKTAILGVNAAMKANVIGIIITLIVALVAGFIYLWNTNEGFRNFFIGAWNAIKTVIGVVGKFIGGVFRTIADWVSKTLGPVFEWLWTGVVRPVWRSIKDAIGAAWSFIKIVFDAITGFLRKTLGPVFTWLNEKIIQPVWKAIRFAIDAAWNIMLLIFDLIVYTLKNIVGPAFRWLYDNVIKPVWGNIKSFISGAWGAIKLIFWAVVNFVKTTLGNVFGWLYEKVIKPVWDGIKWYIGNVWSGLKKIFYAIRDFLRATLGPVFTWLRDKVIKPVWNGIKSAISTVWHKGIKPIFQALGDFITDKVAPAFKRGVDIIKGFWDTLKAIALAPINFIIDTVYNKGIVGTFNKVADAIGSKARLKTIGKLGQAKSNSEQGRGYGGTKVRARARGGFTPRGWTLVGEEGPELVNFASPGMVYTAAQTRMMQSGQAQAPNSAVAQFDKRGENPLPHGGWLSNVGGAIGGALSGAWKKSMSWVRGGLAKAAEMVLSPVKGLLSKSLPDDGMARLAKDLGINTIDKIVKWVKGNDEVPEGEGGSFGGSYDGALGRFVKPVNGPTTSGFGTSRGRYPHAGIDFAVPVGTAVKAAFDGVIQKAAWNAVAGRTGMGMLMGHGKGMSTYYGHLSGWTARPGQQVKAGETIARSGNTGKSTGPHLHFETWKNGRPHNPATYLHDDGGWHAPGTLSYNGLQKPEAVLKPGEWADIHALAVSKTDKATGATVTVHTYNPVAEPASRTIERASSQIALAGGI